MRVAVLDPVSHRSNVRVDPTAGARGEDAAADRSRAEDEVAHLTSNAAGPHVDGEA